MSLRVRLALLTLVCSVSLVHGRSQPGLLAGVLSGGLSRLWRPWSRPDPSRGPDRTETLRSVSTDPSRLDEGLDLDFVQRRRNFHQTDREFSVFNPAAAVVDSRADRRRGAGQERADRAWGGAPRTGRRPGSRPGGWRIERQTTHHGRRRRDGPARRHLTGPRRD